MLRDLAQQTLEDKSLIDDEDEESKLHHIHFVLKLMFFSGQFSKFLSFLIQIGPQYLIGATFASITLSKLGLIQNEQTSANFFEY